MSAGSCATACKSPKESSNLHFYNFEAVGIDGKVHKMLEYKNNVIVIVNQLIMIN